MTPTEQDKEQHMTKEKPQLTTPDTCKHKHMYHSYKTAVRAKKRRNKAAGYKYLRHYQCNVCGFWHLTTERKIDD